MDTVHYVIPNSLNAFLLGAYPLAAYLLGLQWEMALLAAGIALLVGLAIFALGLMGGGDIKLLVVLTLWLGWSRAVIDFLMLTAIMGGVLVMVLLLVRWLVAPLWQRISRTRSLPRILTAKQPVPYGIAIALAFLLLLYRAQVPGLAAI
jgi:prepilin peptidase CpaA